jgi:hypothetical protein
MDILNFISWIKGGRVVTTVDPAKTLIPVGLKDDRRDDGYLAGVISVQDFASQLGGLQTVAVDGVTITGNGTLSNPLVATIPTPSYKVYSASLVQTGVTAPVATILENTLGTTVTFSYISVGNYEITFGTPPSFPKVAVLTSPLTADSTNWSVYVNKFNAPTKIRLTTRSGGTDANGLLSYMFIEIRVYN